MIPLRQIATRAAPSTRESERGPAPFAIVAASTALAAPEHAQPVPHGLTRAVSLSAVAGYVDAAAFVLLHGVFPAHLTGELVCTLLAMISGELSTRVGRFYVLPAFLLAVALAAGLARKWRKQERSALPGLLALVTGSLGLFAFSGALVDISHGATFARVLMGASAVAAMGFQTALLREAPIGPSPTTVMTGNLAHIVIDLVDHVCTRLPPSSAKYAARRARLAHLSRVLLAFTLSAALGGYLAKRLGTACALLPALVTLLLSLHARHQAQREGAPIPVPTPLEPPPAGEFPWFADDAWPDLEAPRALSQPYDDTTTSETRLKVERKVAPDA